MSGDAHFRFMCNGQQSLKVIETEGSPVAPYLHLWESRLREAVTVLERVTIQKLQAAMNDERCIIQDKRWSFRPPTGSCGQFVGSWKNNGSL